MPLALSAPTSLNDARGADVLFSEHLSSLRRSTDRLFAKLLILQWIGGMLAAIFVSPRTWIGASGSIHIHVWGSVFLGAALTIYPVWLSRYRAGAPLTRHVIAAAQMGWSALLIHISGGRIETHFHVFGSLAFLAFYRDWRVLCTATVVVALDHMLRGIWWPQSVFGISSGAPWRWIEHAGWVVFEDVFLIASCRRGVREMKQIAVRQATLEQRTVEVHASETRYRTLFDSIDEGFCIIEVIFDEKARPVDYRFLQINPSFEKQTGLRDAVGKRMREIAPRHEELWFEIYGRVAVTGEPTRFQNRAEELHRWFDVYAFRIGEPADRQVAILFTDITSKYQVEGALRDAKEAAVNASLAKSQFLAHMSHEIRTPLNGVVSMAELLLGTELNHQQRRYADLAKTSAESLTSVINDILDFSKIEAGKLEMVASEFNLHTAVEDVVEVLAQKASKKGVEMACHIHPDVPKLVRGDVDRLRQILINLVSNAVKFTERGSVLVRLTSERAETGGTTIRFTVTDTGIGIPPDRLDRLFKSFSQADASTTRVYGGTGLGLVISKQLVELMGGTIGVESEPGRGSTFWFTAALDAVPQPLGPSQPLRVDPASLRILAVDDQRVQRDILQQQIAAWRLESATAASGEHALDVLGAAVRQATPFRVAILDSDMPGMDGFELATVIKSRPELKDTVLMILLSVDAKIEPARLRAMGFAGHMTKPVRQSQLFDAIMGAVATSLQTPSTNPAEASITPFQSTDHVVPFGKGIRVLVAEDHEINQVVVREILTKAGFCCDVVADGNQAVEAAQIGEYLLILMDCEMPVMDGFDAAREIRRLEASRLPFGQDGRAVRIVALTANAMKGDRERCLAAGMNAYASKPIKVQELLGTIQQALADVPTEGMPASNSTLSQRENAGNEKTREPFATAEFLERCMGNVGLASQLLDKFEAQLAADLSALDGHIAEGNVREIAQVAHALKGAAGTVAASALQNVAGRIEHLARQHRLELMFQELSALKTEVDRCLCHLPAARIVLQNV